MSAVKFCIVALCSLYLMQSAEASIKQRSLVFVFDTTGSMGDDLVYFKKGAEVILDSMAALGDASPIRDYVLVQFNDPLSDFGPMITTKNETFFRETMNKITVSGGGDCPELSMTGLIMGLKASAPKSYVYIMTDADDKDKDLLGEALKWTLYRQSQVTTLLNVPCGVDFTSYRKLAKASSGLFVNLASASEIYGVMTLVNGTLDKGRVDIAYIEKPSGFGNIYNISVDDTLTTVSITLAGRSPVLDVLNPSGIVVNDTTKVIITLSISGVKAVDIVRPEPGEWSVKYGSSETHSLKVTGVSSISIGYGFSINNAKTLGETTTHPLSGVANTLFVSIIEGASSISSLIGVQFTALSGELISELSLSKIAGAANPESYRTPEFVPVAELFFITIKGLDKKGNIITRTTTTGIQAQAAEKPYIELENEVLGNLYQRVSLSCKVDSMVSVVAQWKKNYVAVSPITTFAQSGQITYVIPSLDESTAGEYECVATNVEGSTNETVIVKITDIPIITTTERPSRPLTWIERLVRIYLELRRRWNEAIAGLT